MEENTVVAFRNPSNFQDDPLTEVLRESDPISLDTELA